MVLLSSVQTPLVVADVCGHCFLEHPLFGSRATKFGTLRMLQQHRCCTSPFSFKNTNCEGAFKFAPSSNVFGIFYLDFWFGPTQPTRLAKADQLSFGSTSLWEKGVVLLWSVLLFLFFKSTRMFLTSAPLLVLGRLSSLTTSHIHIHINVCAWQLWCFEELLLLLPFFLDERVFLWLCVVICFGCGARGVGYQKIIYEQQSGCSAFACKITITSSLCIFNPFFSPLPPIPPAPPPPTHPKWSNRRDTQRA